MRGSRRGSRPSGCVTIRGWRRAWRATDRGTAARRSPTSREVEARVEAMLAALRGRRGASLARGAGRAGARPGARRRTASRRRGRVDAERRGRRGESTPGARVAGRPAAPRRPPRSGPAARRSRWRSPRRCPRPRGPPRRAGVRLLGETGGTGRAVELLGPAWSATPEPAGGRPRRAARGRDVAGAPRVGARRGGRRARCGHGVGAASLRHRRGVDPRSSAGAQRPSQRRRTPYGARRSTTWSPAVRPRRPWSRTVCATPPPCCAERPWRSRGGRRSAP